MAYLAYIAAAVVGLMFSGVGIVFAMLHGTQFTLLIGGILLLAHAAAIFVTVRMVRAGKGPWSALVLVLPMFVVAGVALIVGWILALLIPD